MHRCNWYQCLQWECIVHSFCKNMHEYNIILTLPQHNVTPDSYRGSKASDTRNRATVHLCCQPVNFKAWSTYCTSYNIHSSSMVGNRTNVEVMLLLNTNCQSIAEWLWNTLCACVRARVCVNTHVCTVHTNFLTYAVLFITSDFNI
jgi:hypothetical protein